MRVASVQAEARPGQVEQNLATVTRLTRQALDDGAELIVFPEAFVTGYAIDVFAGPLPSLQDASWLADVQDLVDASGSTVVVGAALDRGDRRTLSSIVVRPGQLPSTYDKQHLYASEREFFTAGRTGASLEVAGMEVALAVCYDVNFPEHAAAAAADGATVYVNGGGYFPGSGYRRDLHFAARALDNSMYTVFSALVGAPYDFIGGSRIIDPLGRVIAAVDGETEGLAIADLDPTVVTEARAGQRMGVDRRSTLGTRVRL